MALVTGRGPSIYKRRCKYCKSELEEAMIATNTFLADTLFNKSAKVVLCPKCDGPSPPIPLGTEPAVPSD